MPADAPAPPEAPGVPARRVLVAVGGFLLFAAVVMVGLKIVYDRNFPAVATVPPRPVPQPGLQIDPAGDLERLLAAQKAELTGYGWVDRPAGLIRIPIARAMEILAGKGQAAYDPVGVPPAPPGPIKEGRR
ncbi:MAG: hypothetical protein K2X71_22885 [Methylobacterium sp.]|uniref:hypothetical protein n=1 Tax=Methylobacterium sp. TaxID=409 RepID=UPI0025853683|nr:hypothetical protein [Methylobacterium sp.]MBY0298846.1 hypothetical protein [Methylobacterium sp.]